MVKIASTYMNANTTALFQLLIDDQEKAHQRHEYVSGADVDNITIFWLGTVSAGSHSIKVQWRSHSGTTVHASWGGSTRSLIAIEL